MKGIVFAGYNFYCYNNSKVRFFMSNSQNNSSEFKFMQFAPLGECNYCDREREQGNEFFPPHTARPSCQSGRHNHCTCDTCF